MAALKCRILQGAAMPKVARDPSSLPVINKLNLEKRMPNRIRRVVGIHLDQPILIHLPGHRQMNPPGSVFASVQNAPYPVALFCDPDINPVLIARQVPLNFWEPEVLENWSAEFMPPG